MRTLCTAATCLMFVAGCATTASTRAPQLVPAWTTTGLANPESAIPDATGRFFYVSNVAGEGDAKDGNGFISKLGLDGAILQREWATGLDAPKGLALARGRLFVSDVTQLVEIDALTGTVVARFEAPGAKFLNDVAVARDGTVLVADSGTAQVFALRGGVMETWLAHEQLGAINGLLPERERLVVTTMRGKLLAVDWDTRAIRVLAEGLGNADGVAALGGGDYLVSEWPGRLFHVRADGSSTTLQDSREGKRYINDFVLVDGLLVVPNWEPSSVSAYRLER
jgi:outer membrane protein assembly factor BamB